MAISSGPPGLAAVLESGAGRALRVRPAPERTVDLWPQRLLWSGDPDAISFFGLKVPPGEPGPWLREGQPRRKWRQRFIKTRELEWWFRTQWPSLAVDSYAAVNRFYWPKGGMPARRSEHVVRLGATYVDCDCGRDSQLSAGEAEETLRELAAIGAILPPSLLQHSGRGLWGFWLLRDEEDPDLSPKAFGEAGALWRGVQQAGADQLASLAPGLRIDRGSLDVARMTRLHGSIHSGTGREVCWKSFELGAPPRRYSLSELAAFHELDRTTLTPGWAPRPSPPPDFQLKAHRARQEGSGASCRQGNRAGVDPVASANGRKGHVKLWTGRLNVLERIILEDHQGRIPAGHRNEILLVHGYCWAKLGALAAEVQVRLGRLAELRCEQPLDHPFENSDVHDVAGQVETWRGSKHGGLLSNRRFAEMAGLDPVLKRKRLEELGIDLEPGKPKGRKKTAARRREECRRMLEGHRTSGKPLPSVRKLAAHLTACGIPTGRETAAGLLREYRAKLKRADN